MEKEILTKRHTRNKTKRFLVFLLLFVACSSSVFAQSKTISGVVTSAGEPLIGASIAEKGTTNGTITDIEGRFSIKVAPNATLQVSYLGYETRSIDVKDQTFLDIELQEAVNMLDEFVAIGYGVQQKKLITGATVQVKGDDIAKLNTVNALGALQSQTPGVNITKQSGKPGEGFKVTIRGLGTIGNSAPLYIIDGVPNGDIGMLNPSDIESVDVLKDAASAAIYGARAANGVILITTKQGKKGKASIQYDGYIGFQNLAKTATPLNAEQYLEILNEAGYDRQYFADRIPGSILEGVDNGTFKGTNWLKEMTLENAPQMGHAVNVTSGGDISTFSFGFSYTSQEPVIGLEEPEIKQMYERYTLRLNSEHNIIRNGDRNILTFGETLTAGHTSSTGLGMGTGNLYWNDVRSALAGNPLLPVYDDETGDYHKPLEGLDYQSVNPIAQMDYLRSRVNSKNYSIRGSLYLIFEPIKNLKWRSTFGYAYNGGTSREYVPVHYLNSVTFEDLDKVTQSSWNGLQWSWDNTVSYDFKLGDHKFTALVGNSLERWGFGENLGGSNRGSEFNSFEFAYLNNVKTVASGTTTVTGSPWDDGGLVSFFGRVNYDYAGKYMASVTMRADGSSNFARGHRWGYFPSVSAGWNIHEENFFKENVNFMDQLKIRASWGENGNCNISRLAYLETIAIGGATNAAIYYFGEDKSQYAIGAYADRIANPDLTWETSRQTDIGLDTRFFQSRLGFSFDWYEKLTLGWLVQPTGLGIWGTAAPYINGGDIRNTGVEISLDWTDNVGDFNYSIKGNMSYNRNEVLSIDNDQGFINGTSNILTHNTTYLARAEVGQPLGFFHGYKTDGIFQNQEQIDAYIWTDPETGATQKIMPDAQPGDVIFKDLNNNGVIDDGDKTFIGDPHPDVTYGLSITLGYKGFDFAVTGYGVAGNQIAKSYRNNTNTTFDNYTTEILGRWHGEGTSNRLPAIDGSAINYGYVSDLYIEDGDYFRISNVTLGYDFTRLFKSKYISQLRLYASVQNLFTFTNYSGMDPEIGYGGGDNWTSGIDLGYYPGARTYMFGVNLKF